MCHKRILLKTVPDAIIKSLRQLPTRRAEYLQPVESRITMIQLTYNGQSNTVEPLNKNTFGTSRFVLCREVFLFQR